MKFKKSMLILILAVFLISIAGVCASDVNDTQMASQDDAAIESTDENMIMVEDIEPAVSTAENGEIVSAGVDDEIVGAENDLEELSANPGTYSGLSSEIGSGGDIVLTHDYYTYDNGTTITISTSNSVIDGNGTIYQTTYDQEATITCYLKVGKVINGYSRKVTIKAYSELQCIDYVVDWLPNVIEELKKIMEEEL